MSYVALHAAWRPSLAQPASRAVRLTDEPARYSGLSLSGKGDILAFSRIRFDPEFEARAVAVRFPTNR